MSLRECPKCSSPLDAPFTSCPACPWSIGSSKRAPDPDHLRCENVFQGQRCAEAGTLSENLRGGGPWYCHKHFPPFFGRRYGEKPVPPPPELMKSLRNIVKPIAQDLEAQAERSAIQDDGQPL